MSATTLPEALAITAEADYCAGMTARIDRKPDDHARSAVWRAGWKQAHVSLTAPEPTEAELDAERAAEDEHGWRDRDWT